jgi:UDP-N-acetylglucosamine--N-acetylmuramyl-(pentapeptide) pyrophosphoryl-undecaprenol N-acetylglucosamine transferase
VIACRLRGIPVMVYLPDMTPGWAIRWLSKLAQRVGVSHSAAAAHFGGQWPQGKAVVTGYPVRDELVKAAQDRREARRRLAEYLNSGWQRGEGEGSRILPGGPTEATAQPLPELANSDTPLLLVWGASQGARSINRATWRALEELTPRACILHIVGIRDWEMAQDPMENPAAGEHVNALLAQRYCAVDYLHEGMIHALAAADLTVARAGASILGELTVTGLPGVLVPLPIAGGHQQHNAEALAQAGAAVILPDADLAANLVNTVQPLLENNQRRNAMAQAARRLARPEAAKAIADELWRLAASESREPVDSTPAF